MSVLKQETVEEEALKDRIDYDDQNRLDDVAIKDVELFRLERMNEQTFWIRCYKSDGDVDHVFWISALLDDEGSPIITIHHDADSKIEKDP